MFDDKRKHALPTPQKKTDDVADVIWGEVKSTFETQAISDATTRQPQTRVAMPSERCVEEGRDWVNANEK